MKRKMGDGSKMYQGDEDNIEGWDLKYSETFLRNALGDCAFDGDPEDWKPYMTYQFLREGKVKA